MKNIELLENKKVVQMIKRTRVNLGMSQDELASKLGYKGRSAISKIESGTVSLNLDQINEFAKALDTTPRILLCIDPDIPPIYDAGKKEYRIPIYENVPSNYGEILADPSKDNPKSIQYLSLPESLFPATFKKFSAKALFGLYMNDDSMENSGIKKGDLLIFLNHGDLISGEIYCGHAPIGGLDSFFARKYVFAKDKDLHSGFLMPDNPNYSMAVVKEERSVDFGGGLLIKISKVEKSFKSIG